MTGRMLEAIERVLISESPHLMIVYGDTNSTLAGALAAVKLKIPVAHIEAGLRSFRRQMPEEINRKVVDHISDLLLCPTKGAVDNLAQEGISTGVFHTGDVMYDASLFARARITDEDGLFKSLSLENVPFCVLTIHREENVESRERLNELLKYVASQARDQLIVFPVHPRTKRALVRFELDCKKFQLCEPVGYLEMTQLLAKAQCVYTDSGGLQKEAYFAGTPCVTLRDESEWTETIDAGWNRLWLNAEYARPRREIDDFGDGYAGRNIVTVMQQFVEGRRQGNPMKAGESSG